MTVTTEKVYQMMVGEDGPRVTLKVVLQKSAHVFVMINLSHHRSQSQLIVESPCGQSGVYATKSVERAKQRGLEVLSLFQSMGVSLAVKNVRKVAAH